MCSLKITHKIQIKLLSENKLIIYNYVLKYECVENKTLKTAFSMCV